MERFDLHKMVLLIAGVEDLCVEVLAFFAGEKN
jgi:hypothetical protein